MSDSLRKKLSKNFDNHKGKNHWNWKGGVTEENAKLRQSLQYEIWRNEVFIKNDYTDQKTGVRGRKLVAHHILNFAQYPELRFDVNNGVTLSKESHIEFHSIYGQKNNTREQLEEFLSRK